METLISFNFFKTKDCIGGAIHTEVYLHQDGIHKAYSRYARDVEEEIIGLGESEIEEEAVKLSRKDLRKEWKSNANDLLANVGIKK